MTVCLAAPDLRCMLQSQGWLQASDTRQGWPEASVFIAALCGPRGEVLLQLPLDVHLIESLLRLKLRIFGQQAATLNASAWRNFECLHGQGSSVIDQCLLAEPST